MKISLGYEGATDCCLKLHNGERTKQYGVESIGWHILDLAWDISRQAGNINNELGEWIWNNRDEDVIIK